MTYALTGDQLADIRGDLGMETTFTNAQLDRLYTRAEGDYNTTVVFALQQMWANSAKYVVYTLGVDSLNKDKIFDHIKDMLDMWEKRAGLSSGALSSGTLSLGIDTFDIDFNELSEQFGEDE